MAPHSSTLAWKIPWTEEPGRLQSMGSLRVGYDWVTSLSLFTFMHWRRKWQPTPVFLPWESQGWGSLVGCRLRVAQGWTRLKWLSSSMYMSMYEPIHIYFQAISLIQNWIKYEHSVHPLSAAAAAKSLQSCPTLCDPKDGSPTGSPIPGILKARTLEWVAISYSNAWKWKVKVKPLNPVWLHNPMDCSLPGSSVHGISQARVEKGCHCLLRVV